MIVLSALLVLAALVLLLVGLIARHDTLLIWLSIAASLTAGVLLLIGIVQQRRRTRPVGPDVATDPHSNVLTTSGTPDGPGAVSEPAADTGADVAPTASERVDDHDSAPVIAVQPDASDTTPAITSVPIGGADDADDSRDIAPGDPLPLAAAEVFVLPGRPRYHLSGCRYLAQHEDITGLTLQDAEAKGYTPCGTCRP